MYAIVDIETTGLRPQRDRITEIGIVLFNGKEIVETFSSLFNPGVYLPAGISEMTGITNQMLQEAPAFYEEAARIVELTEGAVFVGHNVRFDYSFISEEFKRLGYKYQRKKLCTLQLMRKYFPGLSSYSLSKLIHHFDIPSKRQHRALDDALATTHLLKLILKKENLDQKTITSLNGRNSLLPAHWDEAYLLSLPEACGVYYMHNAEGDVIYVGKSINIRKRILQHFNAKTTKAARMQQKVHDLHWQITGNELIALLLESQEIKRLSPPLNRAQRRKAYAKAIHLYENAQGYLCLQIIPLEVQAEKEATTKSPYIDRMITDKTGIIAEFARSSDAKRFLRAAVEAHGLCLRLCQLEKGIGACFHYHLKKCRGACCQKETPTSYNKRVLKALEQLHLAAQAPFVLIEKGREKEEACLILVQNGYPRGYTYLSLEDLDRAIQKPEDYITHTFIPHPENKRILFHYLQTTKQLKIIPI